MTDAQSEFEQRAGLIPFHGLGLSVDVYSPDLLDLDDRLRRHGVLVEYYEVFQAALPALALVRERLTGRRLAYHGEGLWISQPDFCSTRKEDSPVADVCAHLGVLGSAWLNIECATKQIAGTSFGTYLPPLYTESGALVAAENAAALQQELDRDVLAGGTCPPLVLLEMPPLTYFACGSLSIPAFFAEIVRRAPCGLVLDIGHLWTVYRYTGAWRTLPLERFLAEFLDSFPLERVVEIHVAGLATHPAETTGRHAVRTANALPRWMDAHGAPIPAVLYDMLDQVLSHQRMVGLKAVALEVDTKETSLIMAEFHAFRSRFGARLGRLLPAVLSGPALVRSGGTGAEPAGWPPASRERRAALGRDYDVYARVLTGQAESNELEHTGAAISDMEGLSYYQRIYLPHEILHWGGDLQDMFPRAYAMLSESGVNAGDFVRFWFDRSRSVAASYDFFLLKIEYFLAFIATVLPGALAGALQEAEELRAAYQAANHRAGFEEMTT